MGLAEKTIVEKRQELENRLSCYGIMIVSRRKIPYGEQWLVQWDTELFYINTYHGKKGFRVVVQTKDLEKKALIERLIAYDSLEKRIAVDITTVGEGICTIGCDESGKGDILGPLVVAAVAVTHQMEVEIQHWGIKDSKCLDDKHISELSERFMKVYPRSFIITTLMPEMYNTYYEKYRSQNMNLNHLLADIHMRNVLALQQEWPTESVIIDQFGPADLMISRLEGKMGGATLLQEHKAEKHLPVGIASVLARDYFNKKVRELEIRYCMRFPKGAGKHVLLTVKDIAKRFGAGELVYVGKLHFKSFDAYR